MTHALYLLQFLDGLGITRRHLRERDVLEDDVRRQVVFARHILAQGDELLVQVLVERTRTALTCLVGVDKLAVGHHGEGLRMLQISAAGGGELQQSVMLDVLADKAGDHRLPDDGVPDVGVVVVDGLAVAELLELVVAVAHDVVGGAPTHEVDDVLLVEVLLDGLDGSQHTGQCVRGLDVFLRMLAVVAVAAVVLVVGLTEIVEQHLPAADIRLGVSLRFLKQLTANLFLVLAFVLHEFLELLQVLRRIEGETDALTAIAAGATRLLIIALEALGNVVVDDEAHIGLVDTHTEGDGGHDDVDVLLEEVILRLRTFIGLQSGVVRRGLEAVELQLGRQLLHLLARETVDDATLALMLLKETDNLVVGVLVALLLPHLIIKVGAVERTLELLGVGDAEVALDVDAHLVGSRCREGDDGHTLLLARCGDAVERGADVAVLGAEVVAPLRDTVGLIDGDKRNLE